MCWALMDTEPQSGLIPGRGWTEEAVLKQAFDVKEARNVPACSRRHVQFLERGTEDEGSLAEARRAAVKLGMPAAALIIATTQLGDWSCLLRLTGHRRGSSGR